MRFTKYHGLAALAVALLAGCAKPAPIAAIAPQAAVGHTYQTMVAVPPATKRVHITADQQAQLQQAFNVIGLKSALMVAALSCQQQDKYDAFMTQFHDHVLDEQHVIDGYFKKIGGFYGQAKEDNFVTLLANNQSVSGIGQGAEFCLNNTAEFQTVMAMTTPDQLDKFATDQAPPDAPPPVLYTAPTRKIYTHVKHVSVADAAAQ